MTQCNDRFCKETENYPELEKIVGKSAVIENLKMRIVKVSKVNFSLLITGESGSGKELVAKAVHSTGSRNKKPFIPVNSASIPENLLESELFGFSRGAFTDARYDRKGMIEEADGGTLFLDEVGELSIGLQAKLLRVIQEGELKRIGENSYRKINVRLICATNRDLRNMIRMGEFREDLYYRIQDLIIEVPPLRERKEDIPLLINHFIKKYNFNFSDEDIVSLYENCIGNEWKGNIRELESFLKRAYTYYPELEIKKSECITQGNGLFDLRKEFEYYLIKSELRKNNWNKTISAKNLKISRTYLFKLINRYGITNQHNMNEK